MSLNFENGQFVYAVDNVVAKSLNVSGLTPTYQVYVGAGGELISQQPSFSSYFITKGVALESQTVGPQSQATMTLIATNADHAIQGLTLSNNNTITFINAGLYAIVYQSTLDFVAPQGGQLQFNVVLNGVSQGTNICFGTVSGTEGSIYLQTYVNAQPNDVLIVTCNNTSASANGVIKYTNMSVSLI